MSDTKKQFRDSAILLAAVTGSLYCISTAHTSGYLSPLRLDPDVLDRNFHQVLYHGLLTSFPAAFIGLAIYAVARFVYSYMFLPSIIDWLRTSAKNKRHYIKIKHKFLGRRKDSVRVHVAKQNTIDAFKYVALAFVVLLLLVHFEEKGKKEALTLLSQINHQHPILKSLEITVKMDDSVKQLIYLKCGARNCAGLEPNSKKIYYFPQNGHSYQYSED
jgi:hypothetical protein